MDVSRPHWLSYWPDLLGFVFGLGVASVFGWQTRDLVWSLWLASLAVGGASLFWIITRTFRQTLAGMLGDAQYRSQALSWAGLWVIGIGTCFGLAFFSIHFGGFHFVHSVFLNQFFPLTERTPPAFFDPELYWQVVTNYWIWLPAAFLAERAAFLTPPESKQDHQANQGLQQLAQRLQAHTDHSPLVRRAAAAAEKKTASPGGDALSAPYRNVIRLHLLIFAFVGLQAVGLDGAPVFVLVYATYFFPWRVLRKPSASPVAAA